MSLLNKGFLLGGLLLALSGCGMMDRLSGGVDNTVLPGQREDAIPGRTQFPDTPDPVATRAPSGSASAPSEPPSDDIAVGCQPGDPSCAPPSGDDTFSDPQ